MKNAVIMLFIPVLLLVACSKSSEKIEKECLANAIDQIVGNTEYQWVVVLPGIGCHGCIQEGEAFMKDYIEKKEILFVLTSTSSLKIMQQKTGIRINEHSNIYIDKENLFNIPTENAIYPCVIRLKDGKLMDHSYQSPYNPAFKQLKQLLN